MNLKGKRILIGISGSIAAYKTAELVRLFIKQGAEVQVIMTEHAKDFVTEVTLSALSGKPVISSFTKAEHGEWNNHVLLGLWADVMIIAPATAHTIAKMANGLCDNLLSAVYLSAKCPVFFAPAMDLDMFNHPSTRANLEKLRNFGCRQIGPATGDLASGLKGEGRMEEPEMICHTIEFFLKNNNLLKGKRILVSAGPTQEAIDPVRFISNHSSGKMGFEIAGALTEKGAEVILVSGPSALTLPSQKIKRIDVRSASDMHNACIMEFKNCDAAIMAAAVADFTPVVVASQKIKKKSADLTLSMKPTVDILLELGKVKKKTQLLVGFALESDDEINNAIRKLESKNLDYIILNSLNDKGATFNSDQNKITIIDRKKNQTFFNLKSKHQVAEDIIHTIFKFK